jgi:hypothetical protein
VASFPDQPESNAFSSNYGTQDFNMLGDVAMQRMLYDTLNENSSTMGAKASTILVSISAARRLQPWIKA